MHQSPYYNTICKIDYAVFHPNGQSGSLNSMQGQTLRAMVRT